VFFLISVLLLNAILGLDFLGLALSPSQVGSYSRVGVPERLFLAHRELFKTGPAPFGASASPAPWNMYGSAGGGHFVAAARLPHMPAGNLDWARDGGESMRRAPQQARARPGAARL
jgi:hypothetical protein